MKKISFKYPFAENFKGLITKKHLSSWINYQRWILQRFDDFQQIFQNKQINFFICSVIYV